MTQRTLTVNNMGQNNAETGNPKQSTIRIAVLDTTRYFVQPGVTPRHAYLLTPHRERHASYHNKQDDVTIDDYLQQRIGDNGLALAARQLERLATSSEWEELDVTARRNVLSTTDNRGNTMLHEAARHGWCRKFLSIETLAEIADIINIQNVDGRTPLHVAASYGNVDDVEILVEGGAVMTTDDDGWTALHCTAASTSPRWQIARRLVESVRRGGDQLVRNALSKNAQNTVLHLAAGNTNASKEFFAELVDLDPTVRNREGETPFHVAAKCANPNVILAMLEIFPVGSCVRATDMKLEKVNQQEGCSEDDAIFSNKPTLLNTCAVNGNAPAVSVLIQRGADLMQGALHEIVQQSVRQRARINDLIDVYRAVTYNVVEWWADETGRKCPKPESMEYAENRRKAMLWLTTKPHPADGKNVLERAISVGAAEMLVEILNTPGVYRLDSMECDSEKTHCHNLCSDEVAFAKYDVTNMDDATMSSTVLDAEAIYTCFQPDCPYLEQIIMYKSLWRDTGILNRQPFREQTKYLLWFASRFYFLLGAVQMCFMISFSINCMPDTCALVRQFNLSHIEGCDYNNNISQASNDNDRQSPSAMWLLWPIILLLYTLVMYATSVTKELKTVLRHFLSKPRTKSQPTPSVHYLDDNEGLARILLATCHRLPMFAFSFSVFIWFYEFGCSSIDYPAYLEATSMVFLFGWMSNFMFFSAISKHVYIFSVLLKEIIIKEILNSFLLIFVFTILAFSFALHTLRQTTLPVDQAARNLNVTVYQVFAAALTMGEFFDGPSDVQYTASGGRLWFFKLVFGVYVCFSAIVLLNVLIAMMNHRYDNAKRRAESVWRFNTVSFGLRFHRFPLCRCVIRVCRVWLPCCCRQATHDYTLPGRYLLNVKLTKRE